MQYFTEKGIERGGRERAVEDLLTGDSLWASDPLATRIGAIDDVQRLKQLLRAAVQVPSLSL